MRQINNSEVIKLVRRIKVCAESGSAEDFEKIISDYDISQYYYTDFFLNRSTIEYILCDLAAAYIQRFPEEFIKNDRAVSFESSLTSLLVKSICNKDEFAYKIADVVFKSAASPNLSPMILSLTVRSGWYEFLQYFLERTEIPWQYVGDNVIYDLLILFDENRYELLDLLFLDISEDDFIRVLISVLSLNTAPHSKTGIEYFFELAKKYGSVVCGGNERITALLENREWFFFNIGEHHDDYYIRTWEYMKAQGLKLHNISVLINFIPEYNPEKTKNFELLKRYVKPLLADDVYIDIFMLRGEDLSEFMEILDVMGDVRNRVYIDFTDKTFPELSDYTSQRDFRSKLTRLIKEGFPLRTEENFAKSHAAKNLINCPQMLDVVLRNGEFSGEQLTELVETCIKEKRLGALNVVRRILDERASSNLKKKPRKDDV